MAALIMAFSIISKQSADPEIVIYLSYQLILAANEILKVMSTILNSYRMQLYFFTHLHV